MTENRPQTVTPYLAIQGAGEAIAFYQKALGAEEIYRINDDDGRVSHAEIRVEGGVIFLSDEYPEIGVLSAQRLGESPVMIVLEVADVDAIYARAVAAGAKPDRPPADGFDGALRTAKIVDPFNHRWMFTRQSARIG
jgi:PhnB protein